MRNDFESNYLMHHDFLMHHGIYGQKWGIRRYQNPDGSLTEAGRKRYGVGPGKGVDDINSEKGTKRRIKDVKKSIAKNNKARGKEYSKIANNPENFLGLNKKHGKKIEEYSENIKKGEEEIKRLKESSKQRNSASLDGAEVDAKAREAARKAGLDQGDNWKMYRDAQAGDKKAQEVVKKWEADKNNSTSKSIESSFGNIPEKFKRFYEGEDISKISFSEQKVGNTKCQVEVDNSILSGHEDKQISNEQAAKVASEFLKKYDNEEAKEYLTSIYYDTYKDAWGMEEEGITREKFKENLSPYSVRIMPAYNTYEVSYDENGMLGYHSLDIEGDLNDHKKRSNSMNG